MRHGVHSRHIDRDDDDLIVDHVRVDGQCSLYWE
jgi:hypothetical protein